MATLVNDPNVESRMLAERRAFGGDRYDEVWEGVYHMNPMPNTEHQDLVGGFTEMLRQLLGRKRAIVLPGTNVTDREEGWIGNYRVPDVAVFLKGGMAVDRDTHWYGGPDFLVEILSPGDESRAKLPFYAKVGVREALLVDRGPWALELFQLVEGKLVLKNRVTPDDGSEIVLATVPLALRLAPDDDRPQIEGRSTQTGQRWVI